MTDADREAEAWQWLDEMVGGICDEEPADIAYSADQMVDAYMAGTRHREASIAPYVEALEWIRDQIAFACQGDCENGVRWLNEKASANYLKDAPAMKEAIAAIQTKIDALLENSHVD